MNEGTVFTIFLDANVLAKPVTRTLPATHNQPAELYRGNRCLMCLTEGMRVIFGLCKTCEANRN